MAMTPKYAGDIWISKRTKQLRYGGGDSEDQWLQPISVYTAGEEILRGHLVSVRLDGGSSYDNVVIKTITSQHLKVVGIAMEHVTAGQKVHVLPYGKFTYDSADGADTYFPTIADSDRGSMLYASSTAGQMTLDRNAALLGALNLIQVGYITNANITGGTGTFDVELQLEGDGRGPIENTQFELSFGETVTIKSDLPKVFAFAPATAGAAFRYKLQLRRPTTAWPTSADAKYNKWIAVYSATRAVILTMGNTTSAPQSTTLSDAARLNFIVNQFSATTEIVSLYGGATTAPSSWGSPYNDANAKLFDSVGGPWFGNTIDSIITNASRTLLPEANSALTLPGPGNPQIITDGGTGAQTIVNLTYLCGASPGISGGPIYVEWDSSLADYFGNSAYLTQGTYPVTGGQVILADKRFANRSNVAGIYIGPSRSSPAFAPPETGLFLRKGVVTVANATFTPGERYFLGDYGQITTAANLAKYPESLVEVGTALTTTKLMVDVTAPATPKGADYPIGAIRNIAVGNTQPDTGFLLMDGTTVSLNAEYPELYQLLVNAYGAAAVDVVAGTSFKIPALTNPSTSSYYQIKALSFGYQPLTSVLNKLSLAGSTSTTPGSISVDVTSLKTIGPYGDGTVPNIDALVIKLFVEISSGNWREIPPGYFVMGGVLYGYVWKIETTGTGEDTTYTLTTDLGGSLNPGGIAYISDTSTATALTEKPYRLSVYKPEAFARYYDVGAEILNPNHNLPPTSIAVANYVDTSVSTQRLYVRGEVDVKDKVDFHLNYDVGSIHNPLTPSTGQDACARLSVTSDGVLLLSNTVNGTYNVFGIASATGATANNRYIINNAGTLEISSGTTPGVNYEAIRASGFQTVSTIKAKENIKPFEASALNIINQTKVMEYNLKNDPDTKKIGFIAENTHEILAGKEHNHMNVDESVALLMKAVQELSGENARLRKRQEAILRSLKRKRR